MNPEMHFVEFQTNIGMDETQKAAMGPEDVLKLEAAAANNVFTYIQQYIKSQGLLQALQARLADYHQALLKAEKERFEERKRNFSFSPEEVDQLRQVVRFFCPKDPDSVSGKCWIAYHMHSALVDVVENPGQLLKRTTKAEMLSVWKQHNLCLFQNTARRDPSGFFYEPDNLPVAVRLMEQMQARGMPSASKIVRKRSRTQERSVATGSHEQLPLVEDMGDGHGDSRKRRRTEDAASLDQTAFSELLGSTDHTPLPPLDK